MRCKITFISALFLSLMAYPVYGLYITEGVKQKGRSQVYSGSSSFGNKGVKELQPVYKEGEVLVKFRKGVTSKDTRVMTSSYAMSVAKGFTLLSQKRGQTYLLLKSKKMTTEEMIAILKKDPDVETVSPNYIRRLCGTPNDPGFDRLWGLHNTGQTGGTSDADIDAPEAWDENTGSSDVVVAVIDSGVDYNHEDLADNMWTNKGEIPGDGIDNDGNGYVDDIYGYDFASDNDGNNDSDPMDIDGHGTHVSGTIAAVGNNNLGVAGVNWTAQIMALKASKPEGGLSQSDIIEALEYIVKMKTDYGVNVIAINASYGGMFDTKIEEDAIELAGDADILFVAAAGNDGININYNFFFMQYPCAYDSANILCVAATDHNDELASFSNYNVTAVDVAAPGTDIKSTIPFGMGTEAYVTVGSTTYQAIGMEYADQTDENGITKLVYHCDLGYPGDFPSGVNSNIALIERGEIYFAEKAANAKDAGAVGVIMYNNEPGNISGTLGDPGDWIPVISISQEDGQDLINGQGGLPLTVTLVNKPSNYTTLYGTSMAAPHVTGLASLVSAHYPDISYLGIKDRIVRTVDKKSSLKDFLAFGGRINAYNALTANHQEPFIYSLVPPSASYGYEITIEGAQLGETQGTGKVTFSDGVTASIVSWDNYQIVCTVPQDCQSGPVTVTTDEELESNEKTFKLSGSISGKVTDEQTGVGIEEVEVNLFDSRGGGVRANYCYTDSNGNYAFWGLETGNYYVCAFNQGYHYECYQDAPPWDYDDPKAPPVPVTIPDDTPGIDLTLQPAATIRGTVTECDTSPPLAVKSLTVSARDWDTGDVMEEDSTDSEGNYILDALPTGKYRICVDAYSYLDSTKYLLDMCRDVSFEVTGGKEYDLDLCLYAGGSISGKVTSGDGIEGLRVNVYDSDGSYVDDDYTDSNGNYAVVGLETGNYYVCTSSDPEYFYECYQDVVPGEDDDPPVPVTISNDTPNIDLTLKPAAIIRGTVTKCDTSPQLAAEDVRVDAKDWYTGDGMASNRTDSEGNYTLQGLPTGKYQICVDGSSYWGSTEYLDMCRDVSFEVTAGEEYDLDLCLYAKDSTSGSISGKVTLETSGKGIKSVRVDVYDSDGSYVDNDYTDYNGNYTVSDLETGNYYVCTRTSNDRGYIDECYQDAMPGENDYPSVPVISPQETEDINFELGLLTDDSYEDDYACGLATLIDTDMMPQEHTLYPAGDEDWVKLDVSDGETCIIETSDLSLGCDTYIYLYDTDCSTLLSEDDDSGVGDASMITYDFPSAGTYYVKVKHNFWEIGTYKISVSRGCSLLLLYGEDSEKVEMLREFRDNVLSQTPEGREIIRLYYQWSPVIVKAMEEDEEFKSELKELIDGVLLLIMEDVE